MESASFDPKKHREDWLKKISSKLVQIDELMPPAQFLTKGDSPPWVERIEEEIGTVMLSAAKLKEGIAITPQRLGAILGHQCAYAVWMQEWLLTQVELPKIFEVQQTTETFCDSFEIWFSKLRTLTKFAFCSCVDQTYEDMNAFVSSYSQGFARKPKNFGAGELGGTNFEIYIFLALCWRQIQNLNSVPELHQVLCRVLGNQKTGDLKRIEKICQRIGLHFRKPGRPRKQK